MMLATLDTANFTFQCLTASKSEALTALREAWRLHRLQTGALSTWRDIEASICWLNDIMPGAVYRDGTLVPVAADVIAGRDNSAPSASVWVVSLEWNRAPSEVTGDTGIVGVYATEAAARFAQEATRCEFDNDGQCVYQYTMREGRYCSSCGEKPEHSDLGCTHADPTFCDQCGAELKATGDCDNDHDEWDIDVHCTEMVVHP